MRSSLIAVAIFHIQSAFDILPLNILSLELLNNLPDIGLLFKRTEHGPNDTNHPPHVHRISFDHHGPASDLPPTTILENRSR